MSTQRIPNFAAAAARARGGIATLWEYSGSLSELSIRISWPGTSENIHLVCNGCVRIEACSTWSGVNLDCQWDEVDEFRLVDKEARLLVVCKQIRIFENVEPRFVAS